MVAVTRRSRPGFIGVSLDIENYCTLRLFFVPLSYVKLDHFDRQL